VSSSCAKTFFSLIYFDSLIFTLIYLYWDWVFWAVLTLPATGMARENAQKTHNRNQAGVRITSAGDWADLPRQSHATAGLQNVKDQGA
jgi:hypothetical protein